MHVVSVCVYTKRIPYQFMKPVIIYPCVPLPTNLKLHRKQKQPAHHQAALLQHSTLTFWCEIRTQLECSCSQDTSYSGKRSANFCTKFSTCKRLSLIGVRTEMIINSHNTHLIISPFSVAMQNYSPQLISTYPLCAKESHPKASPLSFCYLLISLCQGNYTSKPPFIQHNLSITHILLPTCPTVPKSHDIAPPFSNYARHSPPHAKGCWPL